MRKCLFRSGYFSMFPVDYPFTSRARDIRVVFVLCFMCLTHSSSFVSNVVDQIGGT